MRSYVSLAMMHYGAQLLLEPYYTGVLLLSECIVQACKCRLAAGRAGGRMSGQALQLSHAGISHGSDGVSSMLTASVPLGSLLSATYDTGASAAHAG